MWDSKKFNLIAEIGINHLGSVKFAKEMIYAGIDVGINLFKFQIFTMEELGEKPSWQWFDYVNHCALSKDQHFELKEFCDKKKVTYFASVFGDESLEIAKEMDMPLYKLASRSVYDSDGKISNLAKKVYATNKTVISSLGFRQECWPLPTEFNNINLYCVSKYPTVREDIRWPDFKTVLAVVVDGEKRYTTNDDVYKRGAYKVVDPNTFETKYVDGFAYKFRPISGFSDHSIGTELAKEAIDLGATTIEKHFTLDKTLYGPDQKGSALPEEFREIQHYWDVNQK